jgi:hypothetical protein
LIYGDACLEFTVFQRLTEPVGIISFIIQGKIERWHQTLKNRILLENYFLPGDLEQRIEAFVEHYNHQRYHESLSGLIHLHPM